MIPIPEPDVQEEDGRPLPPLPPRNRVGSFFHAFRPASARTRKDSTASLDVPPYLLPLDSQHTSPQLEDSPVSTFDTGSTPRLDGNGKLRHSASADNLVTTESPPVLRPRSHIPILDHPRSRQTSLQSVYTSRAHPSPALRADSLQPFDTPPPVPPKDPLPALQPVSSLWKNFNFLPFLRDNVPQIPDRPATPNTPPVPEPHRGDVICLGYSTLDDRQMRRLEGKSDHRPVIGAYALCI